ncbi:acyl-phosphate glycerol-3-phosphate acyltransferase [Desulfuromusa kysingii]|uniref:Glycerol-3-phosphate acyltransferase n=1 Tax=Desulfuromusa kysingii TaxID=37625 RepID=A0A1H4DEP3_9BACT|nr:glycerol-3-phosphate 1-O-acyltransferase PlsY [Desulfuromusa kysingii]SEA70889.1 acyl-phosphate glycerol-3-phosphate acyltransferase [Desulfuromusa kysingii]
MTLYLLLILAYFIGAIPTGVILTRLIGNHDIRNTGSGNIGATNVYRIAGRKLGIVTLFGDCLKGVVPLLIAQHGFHLSEQGIALVALAAFIGHCYPVYLGFKGGKGVATALGIFLVLSPLSVLCVLLIFILALSIWRYISLASLSAAAAIPLPVLFFERSYPLFVTALIIVAIVIWRHRANIERLRNGTESKFKV